MHPSPLFFRSSAHALQVLCFDVLTNTVQLPEELHLLIGSTSRSSRIFPWPLHDSYSALKRGSVVVVSLVLKGMLTVLCRSSPPSEMTAKNCRPHRDFDGVGSIRSLRNLAHLGVVMCLVQGCRSEDEEGKEDVQNEGRQVDLAKP